MLSQYMITVRYSFPKLLSTSLRISYGLTTSKNKREIVFATKKLRPAWILVVCTTRMLLIGYQTMTLNLHHGATVIKKPSTTPTKPSPSSLFQRSEFPANEMYDDYEENKAVRSEDFDGRSRLNVLRLPHSHAGKHRPSVYGNLTA